MSREKGDLFEDKCCKVLGLSKTANSGAIHDDGDLYDYKGPLKDFIIEAKYKSIPNFRASKAEIEKLKVQANKFFKDWIYIQSTDSGEYVLLSLDSFGTIIDRLSELEKLNE